MSRTPPSAAPSDPAAPPQDVAVWDLPTRLFHWVLVVLIAILWISGTLGGLGFTLPLPWGGALFLGNLDVHMLAGESVLALVLFRLMWGVIGSATARFSHFVRGPSAIRAYLKAVVRGEIPAFTGHNPAGAAMILALLAGLAVQVSLGLFSNDDIFTEGPLAHLVSKSTSDTLTGLHEAFFSVLITLIGLHVAAALYYVVRGENLVRPMVTGRKPRAHLPSDQAPRLVPAWWALPVLAIAGVAVWALVTQI